MIPLLGLSNRSTSPVIIEGNIFLAVDLSVVRVDPNKATFRYIGYSGAKAKPAHENDRVWMSVDKLHRLHDNQTLSIHSPKQPPLSMSGIKLQDPSCRLPVHTAGTVWNEKSPQYI